MSTVSPDVAQAMLVNAWRLGLNVDAHDELTAAYRETIERKVDQLRVWKSHMPRADLIAAGWTGLVQAIESFDANKDRALRSHVEAAIDFSLYKRAVALQSAT